jgi:SAM-dependent methyltransferase
MSDREMTAERAQRFFEDLWKGGDYWDFENSDYEHARCQRLLRMLAGRCYPRVLELGCGAGFLTRFLAHIADQIVALDISQAAIDRARAVGAGPAAVDFRVANIMDYKPHADGPWDLIVFSDTICYLGWLYPFFDVAWLAAQLFEATRSGGQLLLANSLGEGDDWLLRPWIIRTYRDLFVNVGYTIKSEEVFQGAKKGVDFEVLMTLFAKKAEESPASDAS